MAYENQQKKQKYLIWIFVAVSLITATVLYFGFFKERLGGFKINIPIFQEGGQAALPKNINIDLKFFDSEDFKSLAPFEDASPFEGTVGREDPFKPNI